MCLTVLLRILKVFLCQYQIMHGWVLALLLVGGFRVPVGGGLCLFLAGACRVPVGGVPCVFAVWSSGDVFSAWRTIGSTLSLLTFLSFFH